MTVTPPTRKNSSAGQPSTAHVTCEGRWHCAATATPGRFRHARNVTLEIGRVRDAEIDWRSVTVSTTARMVRPRTESWFMDVPAGSDLLGSLSEVATRDRRGEASTRDMVDRG